MWIFITIIITWLLLLPWITSPIRPLTYLSWLHLWTSEQPGKDCYHLLCPWFNHNPPSCSPGIVGSVSAFLSCRHHSGEKTPPTARSSCRRAQFPPKIWHIIAHHETRLYHKGGYQGWEAELRFSAGRSLMTSLWCVLIEFPGARDLNGL